MLDSATRTANRFISYYTGAMASWWDNMGPQDYIYLLVGVVVMGFFLLRSNLNHSM